MSTGAFTLADVDKPDKPKGQFTAADLDAAPAPKGIPQNYGFTAGNMAKQGKEGVKQLGQSLYEMGKDILFPEGESESDKLKWLADKYIFDPADREAFKAQHADSAWESIGHSIASALPLIGPWAASLGEQAGTGDVGGALARGGTQMAAAELAKPALKGAKVVGGMTRDAIADRIYTPEGELIPGAKTAAKVTGGLAGALVGSAVGHEYLGAGAGYKLGPSLAESIFPEPRNAAEARAQSEAYQAKAEDLMRRGKEQEALDRKASATERLRQKIAATNAPLFGNATSSASPTAEFQLPEPSKRAPAPLEFVDKFAPKKSAIQSPESTPADVKVTYQSIPQAELLKKVKGGDIFAVREWQRRGLELPENVRFLVEGAGTTPWRNYKR